MLIASEANLKSVNVVLSLDLLNQVRVRNGRSQIDDASELEEALLSEWKYEFYNEGLWFYTLKRFGKALQVLDIEGYKLLLPIPIFELYTNNEMTQNIGYN